MDNMIEHFHTFGPSPIPGYNLCNRCGTYHSNMLKSREELYEKGYWSSSSGRSSIDEQVQNLICIPEGATISKVDKILSEVNPNTWVLEIGCAPGILMKKMVENKCMVFGIEPDEKNLPPIRLIAGSKPSIVNGYFPDCWEHDHDVFDHIVGMDVVEHIEDYKEFIEAAKRLLVKGGTFIFMSPILYEDGLFRERDFIPHEHAWIFSKEYLENYLGRLFSSVKFDRWIVGHEVVICTK